MMKLHQALEDLTATPVTQSHKKVANNSIPNRTNRKETMPPKHKCLYSKLLQLHSDRYSARNELKLRLLHNS
jgi:hypothetical protein